MKTPKELKCYLNKHCCKCGKMLVLKRKELYEYDSETGEPEYIYIIECPDYSWWPDIFHFTDKSSFDWHESNRYLVGAEHYLIGTKQKHRVVLEQS